MREFNLVKAKAGKPVCTRDGRKARIICFDKANDIEKPIVALVTDKKGIENCYNYTVAGLYSKKNQCDADLMMAPEKHEGWINIYPEDILGLMIHKTEDEARSSRANNCVATIKIEWEG